MRQVGVFLLVGVVAAVGLAGPAPAGGVTLVAADGTERPHPWQGWADHARLTTPGIRVQVIAGACPDRVQDAVGCTLPGGAAGCPLAACVWIDTGQLTDRRDMRATLYHELAHVVDFTTLSDPTRHAFLRITRDLRPWVARWAGLDSPHERFAEAWSLCARGARTADAGENTYTSDRTLALGRPVSRPQHRRVCALLSRAGT